MNFKNKKYHIILAKYFNKQEFFFESIKIQKKESLFIPSSPRKSNIRKCSELFWQRLLDSQWEEIEKLLIDLLFLESKVEAGMGFDLLLDFRSAVTNIPGDSNSKHLIDLLSRAINHDIYFIVIHKATLFQCLWNSCWWYDCPEKNKFYEGVEKHSLHNHGLLPNTPQNKKLCELLEEWQQLKQLTTPNVVWIRSNRPPKLQIDSGLVTTLGIHMKCVDSLAFSPDGKLLASGSRDGIIILRDTFLGKEYKRLYGHQAAITGISFSPDGSELATSSSDGRLCIWNVAKAYEVNKLEYYSNEVSNKRLLGGIAAIDWSPDGKRLACALTDSLWGLGTVIIWNTTYWKIEGLLLSKLRNDDIERPIRSISFSPDSKLLVGGTGISNKDDYSYSLHSSTSNILVWNLSDLQSDVMPYYIGYHEGIVWSVAFSPDGKYIISGASDGMIGYWRLTKNKNEKSLVINEKKFQNVSSPVNWVDFSPDGNLIAISCGDSTIKIISTQTKKQISTFYGHSFWVSCAVFSPDGNMLASGSYDNTVRIWNVKSQHTFYKIQGHHDKIQKIAINSNNALVASASNDCSVRIWDAATGIQLLCIDHHDWIEGLSWSPDGKSLASGFDEHTVILWDASTGKQLRKFFGHNKHITNVIFSPDGLYLTSISQDQSLILWGLKTGKIVRKMDFNFNPWCIAFSNDSTLIAVGSPVGIVLVLQNIKNKRFLKLKLSNEGGGGICSIRFSPCDSLIAGGTEHGEVFIWNAKNGEKINCFKDHKSIISSLAFSPDGRYLVCVGGSVGNRLFGQTKIWDIQTNQSVFSISGYVDASALANNLNRPFLIISETETALYSINGGLTYTFWPELLHDVQLDGSGQFWIGGVGDYLRIMSIKKFVP